MTDVEERFLRDFMRELYNQFPDLRPFLIKQSTRTAFSKSLIKHIFTDRFPIEVAARRVRMDGLDVYLKPLEDEDSTPKSSSRAGDMRVTEYNQRGKLLLAYFSDSFEKSGLTDEEASRVAGVPQNSCWWKRSGELRELGLITPMTNDNGDLIRRKGTSGVSRMVCVITDEGRSVAMSLEDSGE